LLNEQPDPSMSLPAYQSISQDNAISRQPKWVCHSGCMILLKTTSLEFFPLQHISVLEDTFEPLRSIAGFDQEPALTLPPSGFLLTLLTVSSFQNLRRLCFKLRALLRFPLQRFKTLR
jgi:hypothetical protein